MSYSIVNSGLQALWCVFANSATDPKQIWKNPSNLDGLHLSTATDSTDTLTNILWGVLMGDLGIIGATADTPFMAALKNGTTPEVALYGFLTSLRANTLQTYIQNLSSTPIQSLFANLGTGYPISSFPYVYPGTDGTGKQKLSENSKKPLPTIPDIFKGLTIINYPSWTNPPSSDVLSGFFQSIQAAYLNTEPNDESSAHPAAHPFLPIQNDPLCILWNSLLTNKMKTARKKLTTYCDMMLLLGSSPDDAFYTDITGEYGIALQTLSTFSSALLPPSTNAKKAA